MVDNPFFGIPTKDPANFHVLGIPWDKSSSFRRGAKKAPKEIRKATTSKLYNPFTEEEIDLRKHWRLHDLGNLECSGEDFLDMPSKLSSMVTSHYQPGDLFLFLGGDHIITYLTVKTLTEVTHEDFGVIYFDAHPDLYSEYEGNSYSHACVMRRLLEENIIGPEQVLQVGIRASTSEQTTFAKQYGVKTITARELSPSPSIDIGFDRAYLSFDMDVLDPAFAPGVGNPEPGGLSTRTLITLINQIETRILGFDIVEISPPHDYGRITAFAAAKVIGEVLGMASKNKSKT